MSRPLAPSRDDLIDLAFAVGLAIVAIVGFRTIYSGSTYLLVGTLGALAGAAAGFLAVRLRWHPLLGIALILGFYVLFSGPAVSPDAIAGLLPTPASVGALWDGTIEGWARIVTTIPPIGSEANLMVVPYACGFGAGLLGLLLARVRRAPALAVLPSLAALVAAILLGTDQPAALVLQGTSMVVAAVAWTSLRSARSRAVVIEAASRQRAASATLLLVVAGLGAFLLGPHLPMVDASQRFVLRDNTEPPFDPRAYPSPLAGFRNYVAKDRRDDVLLTVQGLQPKEALRVAVMDGYDGVVWTVSGGSSGGSGSFQRVGDELPGPKSEQPATPVSVEVKAPIGVWVPFAGAVHSVEFTGPRAAELTDSFRYNRSTGVGAEPLLLKPGDSYRFDRVPMTLPDDAALATMPIGRPVQPPVEGINTFKTKAADYVGGTSTAFAQMKKLESELKKGYYSDGGEGTEVAPGHSIARLAPMTDKDAMVGNGEQYAALLALYARSLGLPARVALGFLPQDIPPSGPVDLHNKDVVAWAEVDFDGAGWVPFFPTPPEDQKPPVRPESKPRTVDVQTPPPPPSSLLVPPDRLPDEPLQRNQPKKPSTGLEVPAWVRTLAVLVGLPLLLLLAVYLSITALKRRRRRRRQRGKPAHRVAGGWQEFLDGVRDTGRPLPARATRREIETDLAPVATGGLTTLVRRADEAAFAAEEPTDEAADEFWSLVDAELAALYRPLGWRGRLKARLSLASLRPRTREGEAPASGPRNASPADPQDSRELPAPPVEASGTEAG